MIYLQKIKWALTVCACTVLGSAAFGLPGIKPYIADSSGEYIYFRDVTFHRKSYFGVLFYDEKTYAARYFAPEDKKASLPAKTVEIYFTVNPDAAHFEMTGEKINAGQEKVDADIVNYLHDMLREFSKRRAKAGDIAPERMKLAASSSGGRAIGIAGGFLDGGIKIDEDFPQFGGNVSVYYDYLAPIFNIKAIKDAAGNPLLYAVTAGKLLSEQDQSFAAFEGFPEKYADNRHRFKKDAAAARKTAEYTVQDAQSVTLDANWTRSMENLWLCKEAAVLSLGMFNVAEPDKNDAESFPPSLMRQLLLSADGTYLNWADTKIRFSETGCSVESIVTLPAAGNVTKSFKTLTRKDGGAFYVFSMNVFYSIYEKNKSYFDGIKNSYRIKNGAAF